MKKLLTLLLIAISLNSIAYEWRLIGTSSSAQSVVYNLAVEGYQQGFDKWLELAKKGDDVAQFRIGFLYMYGKDDERMYAGLIDDISEWDNIENDRQGIYWLEKSAAQGNRDGLHNIGVCNLYGYGVLRNPPKGLNLLIKAAEAGSWDAMDVLGFYYVNGLFVEKSLDKAAFWINKAFEVVPDSEEFTLSQSKERWDKYELWKYL